MLKRSAASHLSDFGVLGQSVSPEHTELHKPRVTWCSASDAAVYLGTKPKTLEHWRQVGGGPRYAKAGRRCRYRLDWLDEWLESRSVSSTAEARRSGLL